MKRGVILFLILIITFVSAEYALAATCGTCPTDNPICNPSPGPQCIGCSAQTCTNPNTNLKYCELCVPIKDYEPCDPIGNPNCCAGIPIEACDPELLSLWSCANKILYIEPTEHIGLPISELTCTAQECTQLPPDQPPICKDVDYTIQIQEDLNNKIIKSHLGRITADFPLIADPSYPSCFDNIYNVAGKFQVVSINGNSGNTQIPAGCFVAREIQTEQGLILISQIQEQIQSAYGILLYHQPARVGSDGTIWFDHVLGNIDCSQPLASPPSTLTGSATSDETKQEITQSSCEYCKETEFKLSYDLAGDGFQGQTNTKTGEIKVDGRELNDVLKSSIGATGQFVISQKTNDCLYVKMKYTITYKSGTDNKWNVFVLQILAPLVGRDAKKGDLYQGINMALQATKENLNNLGFSQTIEVLPKNYDTIETSGTDASGNYIKIPQIKTAEVTLELGETHIKITTPAGVYDFDITAEQNKKIARAFLRNQPVTLNTYKLFEDNGNQKTYYNPSPLQGTQKGVLQTFSDDGYIDKNNDGWHTGAGFFRSAEPVASPDNNANGEWDAGLYQRVRLIKKDSLDEKLVNKLLDGCSCK